MLGKINASLDKKLRNVKWGEYKLNKLFIGSYGDFDIQKGHINGKGEYVITAGLTNNGILGRTDIKAKIFNKGTITVDMFGFAFYRQFNYKIVTHARVFSLEPLCKITDNQGLFLASAFHFINKKFGYHNMCSWEKIQSIKIKLPIKNNNSNQIDNIDFDFMESFIADLKAERAAELEAERAAQMSAYLKVSGLDNYELSEKERNAIEAYDKLDWKSYNLKSLFGESTRGKRLKSENRIVGDLPFVTAGEEEEGVSAFIGNEVKIFEKNTTTIDMFGSAKYRNYRYGADDHVAVVHTETVPMKAAIFITAACHKAAHTGKFDYGHNFYAKDADALDIMLPTKDGRPDYESMETLISAIQKAVIKDVVRCADQRVDATRKIAMQ